MAEDTTRITISLETVLKNLNRTLRGLDAVKKKLDSVASVKFNTQGNDRASQSAQRLTQQQERLLVQLRELANRKERARQATERLTQSQQRLERSQQRVTQAARGLNTQQDRHVQVFRAMERAAGQFNRTLGALGNSLRSVGQGFASFGATLTFAVSAPLAALTVNVVDAAIRMDSLRRGLVTIAGSSEQAAAQLTRLTAIAKLPGIGFEEAIQGSIALQAVGFSAGEAEKALVQFSNAVALTGGSREQLQTITVQLGQMAAQSKVLAADLKPIINAAPAVAVALRNAFGTVRSEEIQELGISSKEFIDIMIRELDKLPRATAGARNSFDNFRDAIFRASAAIGESLLPALIGLISVVEPIVTGLARLFKALPSPIQATILVLGGLTIVAGPLAFIFGQLLLGVGRLTVGLAQLNATGIIPATISLRALGVAATGTASAMRGAAVATAAGTAALGGAIVGLIALIAGTIAITALFTRSTKKQTESLEEQVNSTNASLHILREQQKVLQKVTEETEESTAANKELRNIYDSLNRSSQARVLIMRRELGMAEALRREVEHLIGIRESEQRVQAALVGAAVVTQAAEVAALEKTIDARIDQIESLRSLRDELQQNGRLTREQQQQLRRVAPDLENASNLAEALDRRIRKLSEGLPDVNQRFAEAQEKLEKLSSRMEQLEIATGRSTREILTAAKEYNLFKGDIDQAVEGIENFRKAQIALEAALTGTTEEVIKQRLEMRKLTSPLDEEQKKRQRDIQAAIDFARENANTIEEARQKLEEFQNQFPEVRKSIEAEARKKPIEEFLRVELGVKTARGARSETGLRNARQQLADAVVQVALASKEREVEIELDRNAALQRAAEVGQRLRILSYQEYLELRASLTTQSLDKEIEQQQRLVAAAQLAQARLLQAAQQAGIPAAERVRRQAQATQANEEQVRAETRLILLQNQRERVQAELTQELKLAQDQQLKDTIQLEIQFAELRGKIEDAMATAVLEEFRESLEDLAKAQKFLNEQINKQPKPERLADLKAARDRNQRQIEAIHNIVQQRLALAQLAAAEKLVENAKERQRDLEAKLTFQVQFRGLAEEESIRRRLEGERKLEAALINAGETIQQLRDRMIALGQVPPPELDKFINEMNRELRGLGELTFVEQFRLAEKEFNRINDDRLRRIRDVERAVNNRNISEAEGLLFIRRINGEYVGDLERQLELLKEIAARSGDINLQRQAQSAEETAKDANDQIATLGRQLRAVSVDSLQDSLGQLFKDLRDDSENALHDILSFFDRIATAISDLIAENFARELIESIFPDPNAAGGGGIIGFLKRVLGIGGGAVEGVVDLGAEAVAHGAEAAVEHSAEVTAATAAATALTTGGTAAGAAMTTGGTTAGAALATGGTTAAATLVTALTAAATAFATTVAAAGAAFAAAVAGSGISQAFGGLGSAAGAGAATGLFPAVPGGMIRIVEGGYPEAVITTDPKHAARQVNILRDLLARTRGFYGRVQMPDLAIGGMVSRETAEANLLSSINRAPLFSPALPSSALETTSGAAAMNLRIINQMSSREVVRPYTSSEEFVRDVLNVISTNSNEVVRRLPLRR